MSVFQLSLYKVLATSLFFVVGCGGSGGSSGDTPSVQSTNVELDTQVQPVTVVASDDQSTMASNDIPTMEFTESDQADAVIPIDTETSSDLPNNNTDAENEVSSSANDSATPQDDEAGDTSTASSDTFTNRLCVAPGNTSVTFEDYTRPRNSNGPQGVYVPFPASGFGWDGNTVCDLEGSRGLDEIEVLVPYVKKHPDTDGIAAAREWLEAANAGTYNYQTTGNDVDNLLLSPVPRYQDGAGYSEWWAMHDGVNLYLRIRVSNDVITQVYSDSDDPWHDDSVEVYIDGDNSKGEVYDGVNDFQVLLTADNDRLPIIPGNAPEGLRIFHRSGGISVYDIEVAINLESAGIEIGKPFGFDVHINEDDNGDERDAKWGWFEKTNFDRSWHQPSSFGTLLLTDCENRDQCGRHQTLLP